MSNYRKINPVYVDYPIDKMQAHLFDSLPDFSPLWECYHRAYVNPKARFEYVPEVYFNRSYTEVLPTNRTPLTSFFTVSNDIEVSSNNQHSATVSLFIQCSNLDQFGFSVGIQRADAEFKNAFVLAYNSYKGGDMVLTRIIEGIEDVYNGLDTKDITYNDMNQWYVFRMDFRATWYATHQNC